MKFHDEAITDIAQLSVSDVRRWIQSLELTGREADIARDLIPEIQSRLEFLEEVGLNYLTLDRGAPTLSGARPSASVWPHSWAAICRASAMCWTNPPSACMRATTRFLLNALHKLGDKGNTLVVVEHDEDTIRRADHVIDIGPSAGIRGGRLVAEGTVADIMAAKDSVTGRYLLHAMRHPFKPRLWVGEGQPPVQPAAIDAEASDAGDMEVSDKKPSKAKKRKR